MKARIPRLAANHDCAQRYTFTKCQPSLTVFAGSLVSDLVLPGPLDRDLRRRHEIARYTL